MRRIPFRDVVARKFDWAIFWVAAALSGIGLFFLYSASPEKSLSLSNVFYRQLIWLGIATVIFWATLLADYKSFLDLAPLLYGLNLFLLVLVLIMGRETKFGVQRWLGFGPFAIQPSELAKISLILILSRFLQGRELSSNPFPPLGGAALLTALPAFLILRQPHLGTTVLCFLLLWILLFEAGLPRKLVVWGACTFFALSPLAWFFLKPYQRERLLVFLNPSVDPLGAGYSVIQSRISIGSGGLFGKGWLRGTQSQLNFLPERHTDFIFSVVAEEGGFLIAAFFIFLFFLFVQRGVRIARRARSDQARLLAVGLTSLIALHLFVNLAMAMGLLPVVGLPLPFVSYGGSWLVTCWLATALLLSISHERGR